MIATKISSLLDETRSRGRSVIVSQLFVGCIAELLLGGIASPLPLSARIVRCFVILLVLFAGHVALSQAFTDYRDRDRRADLLVYTLLLVTVCMSRVAHLFSLALVSHGATLGDSWSLFISSLSFCLPYALPVLIVRSVLGLQMGLVITLYETTLVAIYSEMPIVTAGLVLTTSIIACVEFIRVRSRAAYLRAALKIAIAALPFALLSLLYSPPAGAFDVGVRVLGCFIGGGISGILAVGLTPVVEFLTGYASDMRLIEMATLDHPLLKELSVQAPGTWNHSMVLGMMVESAADAIGANPVVCRVGAYFHDVGKTTKPLYFVENQTPGDNRHDKLSPSMSALIIRAHVRDGIELGRKHRLPKVIEDLIAQHHGTSAIEFFYDKARREAEEAGLDPDSVDRRPFCYPGPKPQTREAGLLMLADGIEAAARTLSEPSFDRIQGMTQKMINKVFASGELEECDLTLKDLHVIAKSFTRVLSGIYHQRIAYTEPAEKETFALEDQCAAGDTSSGDGDRRARPVENLKRLGVE